MNKQEQAYQAFRAYLRKARASDFFGIMQLQDAIRRKYGVDIFLRDIYSVKELPDDQAEMVINICPELEIDDVSLTERVNRALGL